jgi:hypothetical protein
MTSLMTKFGGSLGSALDAKTGVQVEASAYGDATATVLSAAAFSGAGGEDAVREAVKATLLRELATLFGATVADQGAMQAIDSQRLTPLLGAAVSRAVAGLGVEVTVTSLTLRLSEESQAALQAAASSAASARASASPGQPTGQPAPAPGAPSGQPAPAAKNGLGGCAIAAIVVAVGLLLVLIAGFFALKHFVADVTQGNAVFTTDGSMPVVCAGNQSVRLKGVQMRFPDAAAVVASGNCHVTLENVTIEAGTGILASANAHVKVEGGSVTGTDAAVIASANAHVSFSGTTVKGPVQASGNAKVQGP